MRGVRGQVTPRRRAVLGLEIVVAFTVATKLVIVVSHALDGSAWRSVADWAVALGVAGLFAAADRICWRWLRQRHRNQDGAPGAA
jgi:hypothetical protein